MQSNLVSLSSVQLKAELDVANANVKRLLNASLRSGKGPSVEYKEAFQQAKVIWRLWCNALDIEAGRTPAFPADGTLTGHDITKPAGQAV